MAPALQITSTTVGSFEENCYLLRLGDDFAIVDPGDEAERLDQLIRQEQQQGGSFRYILLTHAHLDHVGALGELRRRHPQVPIVAHRDEVQLLRMLPMQCQLFGFPPATAPDPDLLLDGGEKLPFGGSEIRALPTPGHSPGGVTFALEGHAFVGDCVFAGSVGRTDLWGASWEVLEASIRGPIFSLGDEAKLYPGHGPPTTVGVERRSNPFLQ